MTAVGHKERSTAIAEHIMRRHEIRHEHTREVVQRNIPEGAVNAMVRMADELDQAKARLERLERVIGSLAREAVKDR